MRNVISIPALAIFSAVFLGFADTFFLKFWFPEAAVHAPPEPFYMIHGMFFTAWLLLLITHPLIILFDRCYFFVCDREIL